MVQKKLQLGTPTVHEEDDFQLVRVSNPAVLDDQNWRLFAGFVHQNLALEANSLSLQIKMSEAMKNPRFLIGDFWNDQSRSVLDLVTDPNRNIIGCAVSTIHNRDLTETEDSVATVLGGVRDFIFHAYVCVHPTMRNCGIFKEILYPLMTDVAQTIANNRGHIDRILNVRHDDDGSKWVRRGFKPCSVADNQSLGGLKHYVKREFKISKT